LANEGFRLAWGLGVGLQSHHPVGDAVAQREATPHQEWTNPKAGASSLSRLGLNFAVLGFVCHEFIFAAFSM